MALSNAEIIEALEAKPLMEIVGLVKEMEEKWGVSAAAAVAVAPAAAGEVAEEEEQTEFDVLMTSFGTSKVQVIKVVRALTSLGLKEAKELVESVPVNVKEAIPKEEAEGVVKQLEEAGAACEIK
jgi:large subunit ribosomal protein L7/L12